MSESDRYSINIQRSSDADQWRLLASASQNINFTTKKITLEVFSNQNFIEIHSRTHQITHFAKIPGDLPRCKRVAKMAFFIYNE